MERIVLTITIATCFFLQGNFFSQPTRFFFFFLHFPQGSSHLLMALIKMSFDGLEAFRASHSSSSHPAELTISYDINSSDSRVNRWWSPLPGVLGGMIPW